MSTKAQVKTQAKTPAAPAVAHIPQPPMGGPEHEAERPDTAAQLEAAARLGHSFGALGADGVGLPVIQRQEIAEEEEEALQLKREPAAIQRQEIPEEEEEELMLKLEEGRVGPQGGSVPPDVEAAIRRARGGGQPLEGALQEQMSASLGHDFSRVRVHTDSEADQLNQQLHARAFTTGADIFFKRGAYDTASRGGQELIAHELSHVVQQTTGRVSGGGSGMIVGPDGDALEQEAEAMSNWIVPDGPAGLDAAARPRAASTAQRWTGRSEAPELLATRRVVVYPALAAPADISARRRTDGNRWGARRPVPADAGNGASRGRPVLFSNSPYCPSTSGAIARTATGSVQRGRSGHGAAPAGEFSDGDPCRRGAADSRAAALGSVRGRVPQRGSRSHPLTMASGTQTRAIQRRLWANIAAQFQTTAGAHEPNSEYLVDANRVWRYAPRNRERAPDAVQTTGERSVAYADPDAFAAYDQHEPNVRDLVIAMHVPGTEVPLLHIRSGTQSWLHLSPAPGRLVVEMSPIDQIGEPIRAIHVGHPVTRLNQWLPHFIRFSAVIRGLGLGWREWRW
jgi:hypothetical protein